MTDKDKDKAHDLPALFLFPFPVPFPFLFPFFSPVLFPKLDNLHNSTARIQRENECPCSCTSRQVGVLGGASGITLELETRLRRRAHSTGTENPYCPSRSWPHMHTSTLVACSHNLPQTRAQIGIGIISRPPFPVPPCVPSHPVPVLVAPPPTCSTCSASRLPPSARESRGGKDGSWSLTTVEGVGMFWGRHYRGAEVKIVVVEA